MYYMQGRRSGYESGGGTGYMSTQREVLEGQTGATERSEPTSEGGSGGPPPEN